MPPGIGYGPRIGIRPLYDQMTPEEQAVIDGLAQAQRIGIQMPPDAGVPDTPLPFNGPGIQYGPPGTVFRNEGGAGVPQLRVDRQYFAPGTMPPPEPEVDPWAVSPEMLDRQQRALDAMKYAPGPEFGVSEFQPTKQMIDARNKRASAKQAAQDKITARAQMRQGGGFMIDGLDDDTKLALMAGQHSGKEGFETMSKHLAAKNAMRIGVEESAKDRKKDIEVETIRAGGQQQRDQVARETQRLQNRQEYVTRERAKGRANEVIEQEATDLYGAAAPAAQGAQPQLGNGASAKPAIGVRMGQAESQLRDLMNASLQDPKVAPPEQFFTGAFRPEVMLQNPGIVRDYADRIKVRYSPDDLMAALGGQYLPGTSPQTPGLEMKSQDELLRINQLNQLRLLLGLDAFQRHQDRGNYIQDTAGNPFYLNPLAR